jgi:ATP-binding cassette subfamily B protein
MITFVMVYLIHSGSLTVGQWLSLWLFSGFIFGPMQDLGYVISTFRETEASLESFKDLLSVPVETTPAKPCRSVGSIAWFDDDVQLRGRCDAGLAHVSRSIERGRSVAFVGPSGWQDDTRQAAGRTAGRNTVACSTTTCRAPPSIWRNCGPRSGS